MTSARHRQSSPRPWSFYILLVALAFSPYYMIAHQLLGQPTLLGKALLLAVLTTTIVGLFVWHSRYIVARLGGATLLLVWVIAAITMSVRALVYGGEPNFISYRFAFLVFIYGFVALPFVGRPEHTSALRRVLLWSCIVQAVLGIIHSTYFPYIVTGVPLDDSGQAIYVLNPGQGGYRENGTLITSNMYAAFLVLGLILLFAGTRRLTRRSLLRVGFPAALLWWGVALSGSRYGLAGSALVTAYFLMRSTPRYALPVVFAIAVAGFAYSPAFARMQERFATVGSGGRIAIATASVDLVSRSTSNLLLGVPPAEAAAARTANGQILSDNSYASMAFDYGFPLMLLLLFSIGFAWSSVVKLRGWVMITALFIAGQFAVTNAVYWDPFILFAGATLLVIDATWRSGQRPRGRAQLPVDPHEVSTGNHLGRTMLHGS